MHKVLRLKEDVKLQGGFEFKAGTEFEILNEVVYMEGIPVSINFQYQLLTWINGNLDLFINDKRK